MMRSAFLAFRAQSHARSKVQATARPPKPSASSGKCHHTSCLGMAELSGTGNLLVLLVFAVLGLGANVSEVVLVAYISCSKLACFAGKHKIYETAWSTAEKHTRCPPTAAASCRQSNRRDRSQSNEKEDTGHM